MHESQNWKATHLMYPRDGRTQWCSYQSSDVWHIWEPTECNRDNSSAIHDAFISTRQNTSTDIECVQRDIYFWGVFYAKEKVNIMLNERRIISTKIECSSR